MKMMIRAEQVAQDNVKIDPARVRTPEGFRRMKRREKLREGDLFLHCELLEWQPVHMVISENYYTNCIRPIRLLTNG